MRLLRHGPVGSERPGLLDREGNIRDLSNLVNDISGDTLLPDSIENLKKVNPAELPMIGRDARIGACVGGVGKFICIGLNYSDHAAESGAQVPAEPILFMKATSSVCGPNDDIIIPKNSQKTDWEVELGVVIGAHARYLTVDEAPKHIAGFCLINDLSERAFQLEGTGQWSKGKGCDTFGPIGPWLVTSDEVADHKNLRLWLEVDGKRYQDGNTGTMVFDVPFLVSYISQFMSLQPGDIISTGTPPGVGLGQKPPVYLRPGNRVRLGIDGMGTQDHAVKAYSE